MSSRPSTAAPPRVPSRSASRAVIASAPPRPRATSSACLTSEEEVAALVRGRAVDAEADPHVRVQQVAHAARRPRRAAGSTSGSARRRRRCAPNCRDVVVGEVHAVRAPDVVGEPADAARGTRPACSRRARGSSPPPRPSPRGACAAAGRACRASSADSSISSRRDRERRAGRDRDLDAVAVGERGQPLRVGERIVVGDSTTRVGRQAAVRLAEIHRPARRDDAARRARAPRGSPPRAARSRRAGRRSGGRTRSCSRRGRARRGLTRAAAYSASVVDRADQIGYSASSQPKRFCVLRTRTREVLPEVVVRVDEPGVTTAPPRSLHVVGLGLARPRRRPSTKPSVDEDPAALVLGARVVHGHDVGVGEQTCSNLQRHDLEAVDVDETAVGDLQARDHREREERRASGTASRPTSRPRGPRRCTPGSSRSPRRAVRRRAARRPEAAARPSPRRRPRRRCRRRARRAARTAARHVSSSIPTTTMLCASCATVDASAPRCRPEAADEPDVRCGPFPGGARSPRSSRGRCRVGDREAAHRRRLDLDRLGHDLVGHEPDHPRLAAVPRDLEIRCAHRLVAHGVLDPFRDVRARNLLRPAARASASARARTAPGRAGATGRPGSPGAIAPEVPEPMPASRD